MKKTSEAIKDKNKEGFVVSKQLFSTIISRNKPVQRLNFIIKIFL
jgi:hypothetical protein